MMLTSVWRPRNVGIREGAESMVEAHTIVQLRTAGAWARVVAVEMEQVKRDF